MFNYYENNKKYRGVSLWVYQVEFLKIFYSQDQETGGGNGLKDKNKVLSEEKDCNWSSCNKHC